MHKPALPLLLLLATTAAVAGGVSATRQIELRDLVHQDCGSCHGLRLTGGLGPPLTRAALADRPLALVTATISEGRAGTPMPPWKNLLSAADIEWIAQYLKDGGGVP